MKRSWEWDGVGRPLPSLLLRTPPTSSPSLLATGQLATALHCCCYLSPNPLRTRTPVPIQSNYFSLQLIRDRHLFSSSLSSTLHPYTLFPHRCCCCLASTLCPPPAPVVVANPTKLPAASRVTIFQASSVSSSPSTKPLCVPLGTNRIARLSAFCPSGGFHGYPQYSIPPPPPQPKLPAHAL